MVRLDNKTKLSSRKYGWSDTRKNDVAVPSKNVASQYPEESNATFPTFRVGRQATAGFTTESPSNKGADEGVRRKHRADVLRSSEHEIRSKK